MRSSDFVSAVSAYVGKAGYWYGTFVNMVATESLLAQKTAQYPKTYTATYLPLARKWMGKVVTDCVGLIKGTLWIADYGGKYQSASDLSADGFFAKCTEKGPLSTIPEIPGLLLHKPGHIGVYKGEGRVVESVGVHSGVIESALPDRGWTEWGKCHMVSYPVVAVVDPIAEKDKEIASLKVSIQELQNALSELNGKYAALDAHASALQGRIDAYKKALAEL